MVAHLGAVAYAAHQVAVAAESLSFMPGFGFSIAATTIVGQSLGAKEQVQASKSGWEALKLGLMIMVSIGLFFLILPHQIIKVFIPNPEVIELGASCLRIAAFEQPVIAVEMILSGALKGAGDTRWPLYSALVGNWLIRIPLVYLSVFVFHLPVTFVWIVTVIDFTVRSVIVLWRFKSGKWTAIKI
jgi:putative MATE family efflux protein